MDAETAPGLAAGSAQGDDPPPEAAAADAEKIRFCVANQERLRRFAAKWLATCGVPRSRLSDEDVAQHAIAEVLDRWSTVRQPERYIFTVARRHIYQARREGARFTGSVRTDFEGEPAGLDRLAYQAPWASASKMPDPVQAYDERELADAVDAAMESAGLSGKQRDAVELTYREDRPRAEVAERLGMAENTISSHLNRAKNKLKPLLEALGTAALALLVLLGALSGVVGATVAVTRALGDPTSLPALMAVVVLLIRAVIRLRTRGGHSERPRATVSRRRDSERED